MNPNPQSQTAAAAISMAQVPNLPLPLFSSTANPTYIPSLQPQPLTPVTFPNWPQHQPHPLNHTQQHVPICHPSSQSFPIPPTHTIPSQIPPSSHPFPQSSPNILPFPQFVPSTSVHPGHYPNQPSQNPNNMLLYPTINPNFNTGQPYTPISAANSPFVPNSTLTCPPQNNNNNLGFVGQVCPLPISNNQFVPSNTPHPVLPYNNLGQQVQFGAPMCHPNPLPNSNAQFVPNLGQPDQSCRPIVPQNTMLAPNPSPAHNNLGQQVQLCVPNGPQNPLHSANPQIVPNSVVPCPNYNRPGQVMPQNSTMAVGPLVVHNFPATYTGFGPANQCLRPMGLQNSMSVANHPVVQLGQYNNSGQVGFYRPMVPCNSIPATENSSPSMVYPSRAPIFQSNGVQLGINANVLNSQITGFRPHPPQQNNQNAAKMASAPPQINCSKDVISRILGQKRDSPSNKIWKPQLAQNGVVKGRSRLPIRNKLMKDSFNGSMMRTGTTSVLGHCTQRIRPPRILRINYTAEEVEQWKQERRKNYPTVLNISNKLKNSALQDSDVSVSRRKQLREILAKQAELGCEVADIPAHYFSEGDKRCSNGKKRMGRGGLMKKRGVGSRDGTLLKKLLSEEMGRDRRVLLQVFRFMVINSFFKDWPDTPLQFPPVVTVVREGAPASEDTSITPEKVISTSVCDKLKGETYD